MNPRELFAPTIIILMMLLAPHTFAQTVHTPDLDDGTNWIIVQDDDALAEFGFDYSPFGIPAAPNGQGTTGLRMEANMDEPAEVAVISASPRGITVTGQYTVQVDFWINYNVDAELFGTTEFIGAFVGFEPAANEPRDGAGLLGSSDGDAARDYRLFKNFDEQFVESGQYDILSQNNTDPDLQAQFLGQETPFEQTDPGLFDPTNESVFAPDGSLAFGWHTLVVEVDAEVGTANFSIDDFSIGTVDATIGDPVNLEGGVALTFADLFPSISTNPEFSFGVFDNLVITQTSASALLAGDADMDFDFDQLDLVQVQIAAKYLTGQAATWGEGDWDGAPGGQPGNPPAGNGRFDQLDIIAALAPDHYLSGPYAALRPGGQPADAQTSIGYNAQTGEVWIDAPLGTELTSINIDSAAGVFTGDAAANLGGSFDNDAQDNIFKATFGNRFGTLSFGNVAQVGLTEEFVRRDFSVVGSLAGGGSIGDVDLIYIPIPEPSALCLAVLGLAGSIARRRPRCVRRS